MIITPTSLAAAFVGFKTSFNKGFEAAPSHYDKIAMTVTSMARDETYGWLGEFPQLREWVGERIIQNLVAHSYTIKNRKFETTISVPREDMEDDRLGIFTPLLQEMGRTVKEHPDVLVFELLKSGFEQTCYDGQHFFDTDHPVKQADGSIASVSNRQDGGGPAWFLLDTTRAMKPVVWQTRVKYEFQHLDRPTDENTFMKDEYVYGVRGRANAGFGLWQLAFGSTAELNADNYEAARASMAALKGDSGRRLNVRPSTLVVPSALEGKARRLLNQGPRPVNMGDEANPHWVAATNEWADTADLIVTPFLD